MADLMEVLRAQRSILCPHRQMVYSEDFKFILGRQANVKRSNYLHLGLAHGLWRIHPLRVLSIVTMPFNRAQTHLVISLKAPNLSALYKDTMKESVILSRPLPTVDNNSHSPHSDLESTLNPYTQLGFWNSWLHCWHT